MRKNIYKFLIALIFVLLGNFFLIKPVSAENGTMFLSPGSGSFPVGSDFPIKLMIDTDGIPINAVQTKLYFESDKLEIISISKEGSILSLWPQEPEYSNQKGEISLIGGLPQPGFKGIGNLITIKFRAKKDGEAVFHYDESKILANDGLGTNILTYLKGAKYFIYFQEKLKENQLKIFSLTHPNNDEWYSNNSPEFQWNLDENTKEVSFVLDQNPNTIPDTIPEESVNYKKYDQTPDGIWYFHLRFKNGNDWSEVNHYSLKIDTKPPRTFEIVVDNEGDPTNPAPKMYFETQDDMSGIYKYGIKIGDDNFFDLMAAQINTFSQKLRPGNYKIIVRAVDMAYNIVRAKAHLDIEPIETPAITVSPETYIAGEETMYIEGSAVPNSLIALFLKKDGNEVKKWQTSGDNNGQWFLFINDLIKPGTYYLSAMAQDERGAISNNSEDIKLKISFKGLNILGLMITFKNLTLIFILILFIAISFAAYIIFKNNIDKKILRKETNEAKDSLFKNFSVLEAEVQKKIEFFDRQPGFNDQEKKVYEEIKHSLKNAAQSISKEIEDIEKVLNK